MIYQTFAVETARELENLLTELHNLKDEWDRHLVTITHAVASYSIGGESYHESTYTVVMRLQELVKPEWTGQDDQEN